MTFRFFAVILSVSIFAMTSTRISLADAGVLFAKLDGQFRGGGIVLINGKKRRISCRLSNAYDGMASRLTMKGKCATSIGGKNIRGSLTHTGNQASGTYLSFYSGVQTIKSSGKIEGNTLVIFSSFFDDRIGNLIRMQQIICVSDSEFVIELRDFDNKTRQYRFSGRIDFRRK